jgi:hypothetical protein
MCCQLSHYSNSHRGITKGKEWQTKEQIVYGKYFLTHKCMNSFAEFKLIDFIKWVRFLLLTPYV